MADLVVRHATDEDIPRILDTLRAALGETAVLRRTPELWDWKHVSNPFGRSLVLVAEDGDQIAGVRAMMRWELDTPHGSTLRCLRPVDTATHPDFLRRGIFRDLTMNALEVARAEGVHLVFNTPNESSAPGYFRMGWQPVARIGVMVRPRVGRAVTPSLDTPPSIGEMAPSLRRFDDSLPVAPGRPPMGLRTPRSDRYVRWRFAAHPTASYGHLSGKHEGVAVARASTRGSVSELVVSDLVGARSEVIRRLARSARTRYLAGWFSPINPERQVALRAGMIPLPKRTLRLVALPLSDVDLDVFELSSWDLATSDLELL